MKDLINSTYIFIRTRENTSFIRQALSLTLLLDPKQIEEITIDSVISNILDVSMYNKDYDGFSHFLLKYFKYKSGFKIFKISKSLNTDDHLIKCFGKKYVGIFDKDTMRSIYDRVTSNNCYKIKDLKKNF